MESKILENGNLEITVKYIMRGISGRKRIIMPDTPLRENEPLLRHVARAFRWQKYIDEGKFSNIKEMAHVLGLEQGKVAATIRLTLLSPTIIHRIITGDIPSKLTLDILRHGIPDLWSEQEKQFLED